VDFFELAIVLLGVVAAGLSGGTVASLLSADVDREIATWADDGVVTREQADKLRVRHRQEDRLRRRRQLARALATIGGLLVAGGTILFFASNWSEIPRFVRLAILVAGIALFYGVGWLLRERRRHATIGHVLIFVGAFLFGSSIFLVGQMYHVQAHDPFAFLVWSIGAALVAVVAASGPTAGLAVVAFGAWLLYEVADATADDYSAGVLVPAILALYGCALYATGTAALRWTRPLHFERAMRSVGFALAALSLLSFTFREVEVGDAQDLLHGRVLAIVVALGIAAGAAAIALVVVGARTGRAWEGVAVGLTTALVLLSTFAPEHAKGDESYGHALTTYPLLFTVLAALVALGALTLAFVRDEPWLVNAAISFVGLQILIRFVDPSWRMLPRSIAFLVAGAAVFAVAIWIERSRGRAVEETA
jgi:uncharacterized membrane protein